MCLNCKTESQLIVEKILNKPVEIYNVQATVKMLCVWFIAGYYQEHAKDIKRLANIYARYLISTGEEPKAES